MPVHWLFQLPANCSLAGQLCVMRLKIAFSPPLTLSPLLQHGTQLKIHECYIASLMQREVSEAE